MGTLVNLLWRCLTVPVVLFLMALVYLSFYRGTVARFKDPDLRAKMELRAQLASISKSSSVDPKAELEKFVTNVKAAGFVFAGPIGASKTVYIPEDCFRQVAPGLALNIPGSMAYANAAEELAFMSKRDSPKQESHRQRLASELDRFRYPGHVRKGLDFDFVNSDHRLIRENAQLFLDYSDIFDAGTGRLWKGFGRAPLSVKLLPWSLIRFNDERRYKLNMTLPFAFGTLLLACGFFLQFRFIDYISAGDKRADGQAEPSNGESRVSVRSVAQRKREGWIPVWTSRITATHIQLSKWLPPWMRYVIIACVLAACFVELRLNDPLLREEWLWNLPMMLLVGVSIPVICYTLWDLSKLSFNRRLAELPSERLTQLLRPLILGSGVLMASALWSIFFSIFDLPGTASQTFRAIAQIVIGMVILGFLINMLASINDGYRRLKKAQSARIRRGEKTLATGNEEETDILDEFLPGLDARMARACALAILPIPAILDTLLN